MDDWLEVLMAYLSLAAFGALVLVVLRWFGLGAKTPWLPLQRVRRISWKGIDVFLVFWITLGVPVLVYTALDQAGFFDWLYGESVKPSTRELDLLWLNMILPPLAVAVAVFCLKMLRGTRLAEFGLTPVRAAANARVGYVQWLFLTPLVLVIEVLAVIATPDQWRMDHPLVAVGKQSLDVIQWVMMFAGTAFIVPVVEELIFRGILLPWQIRAGWEGQMTVACCAIFFAALEGMGGPNGMYNPAPVTFVLAILPGLFLVPLLRWHLKPAASKSNQPPDMTKPEPAGESEAASNGASKRPAIKDFNIPTPALTEVAVFTNGLFFAAMHSQYWPSPIPLFLLAMGLSWVAYRTSSLAASVTLHGLFNATTLVALLLQDLWA